MTTAPYPRGPFRHGLVYEPQAVARVVAAGLTPREAAEDLGLTPTAVEWHLSRVLRKLGARSRAELPSLLTR